MDTQQLIDRLNSRDSLERGAAVDAIVSDGTRNIEALYPLLNDPDGVVRFKVACALAEWDDDRGLPVLIGALAIRELCFMALEALYLLAAPQAVPELKRFSVGASCTRSNGCRRRPPWSVAANHRP